jgi:hypothetical protein
VGAHPIPGKLKVSHTNQISIWSPQYQKRLYNIKQQFMIQYIKNKYENESIRQCRNKVDISGDLMTGFIFSIPIVLKG